MFAWCRCPGRKPLDNRKMLSGILFVLMPARVRKDRFLPGYYRQFFSARCTRKKTGPNPTDRRKAGSKHHILVEAQGIPLSVILPPTAIILAADLSVASAIHSRGAPATAFVCIPRAVANPLTSQEKAGEKRRQECLAGVEGLLAPDRSVRPPLRSVSRRQKIRCATSRGSTCTS